MYPIRASDPGNGYNCLSPFNLSVKTRFPSKSLGIHPVFDAPGMRSYEFDVKERGSQYSVGTVEIESHVPLLIDTFERCREDEILKSWGRHRTERSLDMLLKMLKEKRDDETPDERNINRRALRSLLRFTRDVSLYPPSLFIRGIKMGKFASFAGGFADVHKGNWNGTSVAVKRLRLYSDDSPEKRQKLIKTLFREALIWCTLGHRNILPLVGVCLGDVISPPSMVSPWMENGNIVRYTTSKKACQSTIDVMLREVATGLEYLHARGFIHGDIRGANILVDQDLHPCIADFGLAHLSDMSHSNTGSGSARWMAPELHDPRTFGLEHSVRTRQSDVFAFGMLCLEVSSGLAPFSNLRTDGAALLAIIRGERPKRPVEGSRKMSDALWVWATSCWRHYPGMRLSMKELLEETVRDHEVRTSIPATDSLPRLSSRSAVQATPSRKYGLKSENWSHLRSIGIPPTSGLLMASRQTSGKDGDLFQHQPIFHDVTTEDECPPGQPDVFAENSYLDLTWETDFSEGSERATRHRVSVAPVLPFVRVPSRRS